MSMFKKLFGGATKWYCNPGARGRPRSPSDFIVTGDGAIPVTPIAEWFPRVSRDPWSTRMGFVPIKEMGSALSLLSQRVQEDHGATDSELQKIFDSYIGIVCLDCLAAITVDLLRLFAACSQLGGSDQADPRMVRLLSGQCHNCDFDHYGVIWFGEA